MRCFVILDSDRYYFAMPLKPDKKKVEDYLIAHTIPNHILEKREMENYMPDIVLRTFNDDYLNLYLKLTNLQKDYFDLQKGFNKNRSDKDFNINILSLYANISENDWRILKNGIKLSPYDKSFKSEFPKLFETSPLIDKQSLLSRADSMELQEILNKIAALL